MSGTASIAFDVFAKDRASSTFTKVGRAADGSSSKLHKFGAVAAKAGKIAVLGLAAGVAAAGVALYSSAKAAVADQAAQVKLAKQLQNSAGATREQISATEDWITKQGVALGVTDDDLRPALSRLVAVTKDVDKAQRLASLSMDVSAGTGKSLKQVTEALAKAQNGNLVGLSKLGVATKNADGSTKSLKDITEQLAQTYEGQASSAANTAEGKFGRLKLIFDETKESIGSKLLPVLTDMAGWFLDKGLPALSRFGEHMSTTFGPILAATGDFIKNKLVPAFRDHLIPAAQDMYHWFVEKIAPGIKATVTPVIEAVRGVLDRLKRKVEENRPQLEKLGHAFRDIAEFIANKVAPVLGKFYGFQLSTLGRAIGVVIDTIGKLVDAFVWTKQKVEEVGEAFGQFKTAAQEKIAAAVEWVKKIPTKIKNAIGDLGTLLYEAGKDIMRGLWNGIKDGSTDVIAGAAGVATHIALDFADKLGIRSPSTVFIGFGRDIMAGLVKGIEGGKVPVLRALDKVTAFIQRQGDKLRDLLSKRADLADSFGGFTSSVFGADLSNEETGAPVVAANLLAFQKAELTKALRLKADVAKLLKAGLSKDLIQQLASSGESGIAQIHALAGGSQSDVQQLNSLNAQTQAALNAAGMNAGNAVYGDQIAATKQATAIATEIRRQLEAWSKQQDKNTIVQINLTGKTLRMSLLELKRQTGEPLGLS